MGGTDGAEARVISARNLTVRALCLTDVHHRDLPPRLQLDVKRFCWKVLPCDPFVYAP